MQIEFPSRGTLTDNGNGHQVDSSGNHVATIDCDTGSIQMGTVSTLGWVNLAVTTDGRLVKVDRSGKILGELRHDARATTSQS